MHIFLCFTLKLTDGAVYMKCVLIENNNENGSYFLVILWYWNTAACDYGSTIQGKPMPQHMYTE